MITDVKYRLGISSNGNKPRYFSDASSLESIIDLRIGLINAQDAAGIYCKHCKKHVTPDKVFDALRICPKCDKLLKPPFNYTIEPLIKEGCL